MIGKVFNWVGGGFFRTLGRFIAFLVLGFIVSYFITKSNINLPSLFGLEYVKAVTLTQEVSAYGFSTINQGSYESWMGGSWSRTDERFHWEFSPNDNKQAKVFRVSLDNKNLSGHDFVEIAIAFTTEGGVYSTTNNQEVCQTWSWSINNNNSYDCISWAYVDNGQKIVVPSDIGGLNVGINAIMEDNTKSYCWIQNGMVVCPTYKKRVKEVWFEVFYRAINYSEYQGKLYIELDRNFMYYDSSTPTSAIESQTQQQQQQHNETMSFFSDTNITEANSTATSFFENFSDTDHGGLSSIITAPLTTIQSMLSNTCVAPSATWRGATITLPCGDFLWSRPGADGLKNLVNVFYGGFVCYYAIRRLFLLIENLKDPTYDKIEVVDL